MPSFFKHFFYELNESFSVIIDDDERVAYAYLYNDDNIIGDVWLYNVAPTPKAVDWNDDDEMPFLNSEDLIKENIEPIKNESEVRLKWNISKDNENKHFVEIYIRERLIAKLASGSLPGWSTVVGKDGPLAKIYVTASAQHKGS